MEHTTYSIDPLAITDLAPELPSDVQEWLDNNGRSVKDWYEREELPVLQPQPPEAGSKEEAGRG